MKLSAALFTLALAAAPLAAHAGGAEIRKAFLAQFPGAKITEIVKTPYSGLYEVFMDGQLVYASADGRYVFLGNVIDLADHKNLTEARMNQLMKINFNSLPFDQAIKWVKGDGSRKLAVFTDPDCPFCRKLEPELAKLNNVTLYLFPYPIPSLHPGSEKIAEQIWCSADRIKAWNDYMLKGIAPTASPNCPNPVKKNMALGEKLGISGTPTLFFANGQRIPGLVPAEQLDRLLSAAK